jgi:hypothetical protein
MSSKTLKTLKSAGFDDRLPYDGYLRVVRREVSE